MSKVKVKCPKCKNKQNLVFVEVWKGHTIQWVAEGTEIEENEGTLEMGDPYKVECSCKCGHNWTVRNASQISDVFI